MSSKEKKLFVGIDMSTDPKKIAICAIKDSDNDTLSLLKPIGTIKGNRATKPEVVEDSLVNAINDLLKAHTGPVVLAVDVPFGWPSEFCKAAGVHQVGTRFGEHVNRDRAKFRYRTTDCFVRAKIEKFNPLSVSTDRLGLTAIFSSGLIQRLESELKFSIDLGKDPEIRKKDKVLIEVYPKATMMIWKGDGSKGFKEINSKSKLDDYKKAAVACANELPYRFERSGPSECDFEDMHQVDAFVCALTAKFYSEGMCFKPKEFNDGTIDPACLEKEGWIWLPRGFKKTIGNRLRN